MQSMITFLNGETLTVDNETIAYAIQHTAYNDEHDPRTRDEKIALPKGVSYYGPIAFNDPHSEFGHIPLLSEIIANADLFFFHGNQDTVYSTKSIFKIDNILD